MSADFALQKAIYGALIADADVAAIVAARVFDFVPRDAAFPYLVIGDARERDWSTGDSPGSDLRLTLRAHSRAGGRREAKQLIAAMRQALTGRDLAPNGFHTLGLYFVGAGTSLAADGMTWTGTLELRALMEPSEIGL